MKTIKKKELIEKIKREMPRFKGNEEEIEIKTALYVYTKIAEMKKFDERYYFGNHKEKEKIYKKSKIDAKDAEKLVNKKRLICTTMSKLYEKVLEELGIKAITLKEDVNDVHESNRIILKNGKILFADIQMDMLNIKTKSKIEHFKFMDENKLTEEELTNMLKDIGYINSEEDYKNKKIDNLQKQIEGKSLKEILEIILNSDILKMDNEFGIAEIDWRVKNIIRAVIPQNIRKDKIHQFECSKKIGENKEYSICINVEEKDELDMYLYSIKNKRFMKCDLDKIEELRKQGLQLGKTGKEAGVKIINRKIKNKTENIEPEGNREK